MAAASLLVYRERGRAGLLRRTVDWRRIRDRRWYVPLVLLPPGIYALTYGVLWLLDRPLPVVRFPLLPAAGQLVVVLGVVWAGFHLVPLVQHGRSAGWR